MHKDFFIAELLLVLWKKICGNKKFVLWGRGRGWPGFVSTLLENSDLSSTFSDHAYICTVVF